jgi:hypothetical protein
MVSLYNGQIMLLPADRVKNMQRSRGGPLSGPRLFPPPCLYLLWYF